MRWSCRDPPSALISAVDAQLSPPRQRCLQRLKVAARRRACEHVFVTPDGSAYTRLLRALRAGNLLLVRANAAELGRVDLPEALAIVELIRAKEPERFDAAAVRWAGRLALERNPLKLLELSHAVRSLSQLPDPAARQLLLALADPRRHGTRP
jgi:hypothetical protein